MEASTLDLERDPARPIGRAAVVLRARLLVELSHRLRIHAEHSSLLRAEGGRSPEAGQQLGQQAQGRGGGFWLLHSHGCRE